MLKRLLVLAAAVGSLAAPLSAQTTFFASGGDVTFNPTGLSNGVVFNVFLQAAGGAQQLIMSDNGTQYSLLNLGQVANTSLGALGILHLGPYAAGTPLIFSIAIHGNTYNVTDFYFRRQNGYDIQLADIANNNSDRVSIQLRGIASAEGLQCPGGTGLSVCSDVAPVTSTPEPGTWALMATGLAGLIPVVRRRRATQQPS